MAENDSIERNISETHQYARTTFQSLVTWFTVFTTVNYATMGWLAKDTPRRERVAVAALFLTQNTVAIVAVFVAGRSFRRLAEQITRLVRTRDGDHAGDAEILPRAFYQSVCMMMGAALLLVTAAWIYLGVDALAS